MRLRGTAHARFNPWLAPLSKILVITWQALLYYNHQATGWSQQSDLNWQPSVYKTDAPQNCAMLACKKNNSRQWLVTTRYISMLRSMKLFETNLLYTAYWSAVISIVVFFYLVCVRARELLAYLWQFHREEIATLTIVVPQYYKTLFKTIFIILICAACKRTHCR